MAGKSEYRCGSAAETLEWVNAIVRFVEPNRPLINAHVVNFFTDRLWESLDRDWIDCLRHEPVESLLLIPSGVVQEHWPVSLKEFVLNVKALSFPRDQVDLHKVFPGLELTPMGSVLAQGMNAKKKHEVEVLSALVSSVASEVGARKIVDVGSGQGYLSQVLSFQYGHSVVAIDSSSHHGYITETRAERIKKHYAAQMRKSGSEKGIPDAPETVTCRLTSIDAFKALTNMSSNGGDLQQPMPKKQVAEDTPSFILAGLHACGDLSVTMLKTFLEWKEVKAVVSIGCCYNLLSEEYLDVSGSQCGFPMSDGVKSAGISLGKSSCDLACQSAERWRTLGTDNGVHNFELHAFRAAFQMVLRRYFPETTVTSPSVGRQGKALRRRQQRRNTQTSNDGKCIRDPLTAQQISNVKEVHNPLQPEEHERRNTQRRNTQTSNDGKCIRDPLTAQQISNVKEVHNPLQPEEHETGYDHLQTTDHSTDGNASLSCCSEASSICSCMLFKKFSLSALSRLHIEHPEEVDLHRTWKEAEPYAELIGPYWSLRAALGPVLETLILLDRLLFLQERDGLVEATMLPIFDPALSPRNVAIIAKRT